jgi:hypothetical protein
VITLPKISLKIPLNKKIHYLAAGNGAFLLKTAIADGACSIPSTTIQCGWV